MVLKAAYDQTNNRYQGTELITKQYYSYGYYEIRAKMNLSQGIVAAFWLVGDRNSESKMEYEVDIFESFGGYSGLIKHTALAHHYPYGFNTGSADAVKHSTKNLHDSVQEVTELMKTAQLSTWAASGDLGTYYKNYSTTKSYFQINDNEWHTYGLDWRKDSITWYVDGIATAKMDIPEEGITYNVYDVVTEKYSDLTYFFNEPMQIKLSLYCDRFTSGKSDSPWSYVGDETDWVNGSSMEIDYVHVYQYE